MSRKYERSHPWLTFGCNLNSLSARFWMLLGRAAAKAKQIAYSPLEPAEAKRFYTVYLAKGANATTQIEGNTLTEEEVRQIVEGNFQAPPSRRYLQQEVQNVIDAYNELAKQIEGGQELAITLELIKWMNREVQKGLELEDHVNPGHYRRVEVHAGGYRGAPVEDLEYLTKELCRVLRTFPRPADQEREYAFIKAVFAHLYIAWIHPFGDGNGRTARLLEFIILLAAGYPKPTTHLLSNHYNLTRNRYYQKLDNAKQPGSGVGEFFEYALQGFMDGLKEQTDKIHDEQFKGAWINFVHETFRARKGAAQRRRRELALALPREFIKVSEINTLTPELTRSYAVTTNKARSGDLNDLESLGLIERRHGTVRAKMELVLAFLPYTKKY